MLKTIISFIIQKSKLLKSLKFRILVIELLVGVVSIAVMRNCILKDYRSRAVSNQTNNAVTQFRILSNHLSQINFLENTDDKNAAEEFSLFSSFFNGRILIIDSNFRVVVDTYNMSVGKTMVAKEIIDCAENGTVVQNYDDVNSFIELTVPIYNFDNKTIKGVIFASSSTSTINDNIDVLRRKNDILVVALMIVIFAFSVIASSLLVRPFDRITKVIDSVDADVGVTGVKIPDFTETESIMEAFDKLLTRMKTLDDSRQEFVSNVSHELKTPLASMKVLADSIRMSDDVPIETYREFMDDIADEVDRENQIITDLLSLVKMDKKAGKPNISNVDVNAMLSQMMKMLQPIAEKANIELIYDDGGKQINAEIDETKMNLAIMNLVENAIKYNKPGGWVRVESDADYQFFTVKVSDSGIGIPEDSIEHIFERFYRVDKSHSREIGGTGLGLAITRTVILLHRGAVKATSVEGEGTTFLVRIPVKYVE